MLDILENGLFIVGGIITLGVAFGVFLGIAFKVADFIAGD